MASRFWRLAVTSSSAWRRRALSASRCLSSSPRRLVSAVMRARTAASLAFAWAESPGEAARTPAAEPTARAPRHTYVKQRCPQIRMLDRKHTSLVAAAILARPKKRFFVDAATVRIHEQPPIPRDRGGGRGDRRRHLRDSRAHSGLRGLVLLGGGA